MHLFPYLQKQSVQVCLFFVHKPWWCSHKVETSVLEKLSQKFDFLSHGILVTVVVIDGYGGAQDVPSLIQRACKMVSSFKRIHGKLRWMWMKAFTFPLASTRIFEYEPRYSAGRSMLKKKRRKKLIKIQWLLRLGVLEHASAENLTIWTSSTKCT